ncbi:DUF1203 domain-containing protein [Pseudotabrizicola alkalilacus]|uniref:DUF1203 domain-containing protein n=1 Tax=Pseudotabrizicola alkalilacus TaxID=2305252 RepID=A0A411Z4K4_9RHOB|nr:DUF1203 domain-containing protein [Pseudotabrizicola alkalilacus]RGP37994.1 DUF1203 domain-containing protein [Pseudotabrizicola alkalilacus]
MSEITFHALPTELVQHLRGGGADAYGMPPERAVSTGSGTPCRHCLDDVPEGAGMLILAHRPFPALQPYAETGPVFLCADACARWSGDGVPPILTCSVDYLLKGYTADFRICYGTGKVVAQAEVAAYAAALLARPEIAFVDVRSARNNCFLCRIGRGRQEG